MEERRDRPLTLVSAPAGYGKTTLISSWLETLAPYAPTNQYLHSRTGEDNCPMWPIACLGFDKSIALNYNPYKLVIPTDREQCPDGSVG